MKIRLLLSLTVTVFALHSEAQSYNILDFGAIPDNKTINTRFIQAAVDTCASKGGGTVYVPVGTFLTGTFELRSNVNLYLEMGAELKGSPDLNDYRDYQAPNYDVPAHYGILYTHKTENVSISGFGAINGNDEVFFEWEQVKKIEWGGVLFTRQKEKFRSVSSGIGDGPVEPKERPRQMVLFSECKNVTVKDIMLINSPFWTLHFADCDGVVANGLKVWASMEIPNSDGIDITSCRNVLVSDCDIRTGDDALVISGYAYHFELPGYHNLRHEVGNINIVNCNLQSRSSGIRIGFTDQNTVRNINISNSNITSSNRGIGIFLRDEGSLENITFSQINIETRLHTGDWWGNGEPIHISAVRGTPDVRLGQIRNIVFRDITCTGESGIILYGSEESIIEDIQFENIQFTLKNSSLNDVAGGNIDLRGCMGDKQLFDADIPAFYAQYVWDISLRNVELNWGDVKEKYFTYGIYVKNFDGLLMEDVRTSSSPSNSELKAIKLEDGQHSRTDIPEAQFEKINIAR